MLHYYYSSIVNKRNVFQFMQTLNNLNDSPLDPQLEKNTLGQFF